MLTYTGTVNFDMEIDSVALPAHLAACFRRQMDARTIEIASNRVTLRGSVFAAPFRFCGADGELRSMRGPLPSEPPVADPGGNLARPRARSRHRGSAGCRGSADVSRVNLDVVWRYYLVRCDSASHPDSAFPVSCPTRYRERPREASLTCRIFFVHPRDPRRLRVARVNDHPPPVPPAFTRRQRVRRNRRGFVEDVVAKRIEREQAVVASVPTIRVAWIRRVIENRDSEFFACYRSHIIHPVRALAPDFLHPHPPLRVGNLSGVLLIHYVGDANPECAVLRVAKDAIGYSSQRDIEIHDPERRIVVKSHRAILFNQDLPMRILPIEDRVDRPGFLAALGADQPVEHNEPAVLGRVTEFVVPEIEPIHVL